MPLQPYAQPSGAIRCAQAAEGATLRPPLYLPALTGPGDVSNRCAGEGTATIRDSNLGPVGRYGGEINGSVVAGLVLVLVLVLQDLRKSRKCIYAFPMALALRIGIMRGFQ